MTTIGRVLENPADLWQESFRLSSALERQILLTLATLPYRPWPVDLIRELVAPADALDWPPALHTLDTTWLEITGEAADRLVSLANPGCRDYLLGILDDTAVALEQLARVRQLPQLVSLVQSAGLSQSPNRSESTPARAELAGALTSRRDQILTQLKPFAETELASGSRPTSALRTMYDTAMVLQALDTAESTAWFLDLVAEFNQAEDNQPSVLPIVDSFALAEIIDQLASADPDKRHQLARTVALNALKQLSTLHVFDAFEALPDELRLSPDLQAAAHERAQVAIEFEYNQALDAALDADEVDAAAQDLEQRAEYYGVALDIGPLLDRADDLRQVTSSSPDWPAADAGDNDSTDGMELHQLFALLSTDSDD